MQSYEGNNVSISTFTSSTPMKNTGDKSESCCTASRETETMLNACQIVKDPL